MKINNFQFTKLFSNNFEVVNNAEDVTVLYSDLYNIFGKIVKGTDNTFYIY